MTAIKEQLQQLINDVETAQAETSKEIKEMNSSYDKNFEQSFSTTAQKMYLLKGIKKIISELENK